MAYITLVAGTTITAAWANANVRDQSVSPFASAAARSSAITSPVEGMVTHLNDVNSLGVYSGAAWSTVGPVHGAPTAWTPAVVQLGAVTTTNVGSTYSRLGRLVFADFNLTVTGSGTSANMITVTLPVAPAFTGSAALPIGVGRVFDTSVPINYPATLELLTATTMSFRTTTIETNEGRLGLWATNVPTLAAGDTLHGTIQYVAAADA